MLKTMMIVFAAVSQTPDAVIKGFKLLDQQPDHFYNELMAEQALHFQADQKADLENVHVFIKKDSELLYDIASKLGMYSLSQSRAELWSDVVIVTRSGFKIMTSWMEWQVSEKRFTTPEAIAITGDKMKLTSLGSKMDLVQDQATFPKEVKLAFEDLEMASEKGDLMFGRKEANFWDNVQGKAEFGSWTSQWGQVGFVPKSKGSDALTMKKLLLRGSVVYKTAEDDLNIRSTELEVERKGNKGGGGSSVAARGGVTAEKKDPALVMQAQSLTVSGKNSKEQELFLEGEVVIRHNERIAKSRSARVQVKENQVNLFDEASIESKGDKLFGKRIVFFLNSDNVVVKEALGTLQKE